VSATVYIWLACVMFAWAPASGPVEQYQLEISDAVTVATLAVPAAQSDACFPRKHIDYTVRVRGVAADGTLGPWSGVATIHRLHDFDADGDGSVGMPDFGSLVKAYLDRYRPNGTVERVQPMP
jgi:hypothetical protein